MKISCIADVMSHLMELVHIIILENRNSSSVSTYKGDYSSEKQKWKKTLEKMQNRHYIFSKQ